MHHLPKVSVITAVYNGILYLEQTIQSVLAQTYPHVEYIIIDGGSTDGSVELIKNYSDKIGYWISEEDRGIYDAWNKGIEAATGEWIAFLGADDILLPTAVEQFVKGIGDKKVDFVSSKVEFVDNDLRHLLIYGRPWNWASHKRQMKVSHVGAFHHKNLFASYGMFNPEYKIAGDYEFLLRPKDKLKTLFIPIINAKMRATGVSKSTNKVFKEAMRAKVLTGGRHPIPARIEYHYQIYKNQLVSFIRGYLNRKGNNEDK